MILDWQLGPKERRKLSKRLGRLSAFNVDLRDRNFLRRSIKSTKVLYPDYWKNLKILPVSSTEWMSEFRQRTDHNVIVLDFEQINALNLLFSLRFTLERPIFHFIEFNIRASELLLSAGQPEAALRIAQASHIHLHQYAEKHGIAPRFPRPINVGGLVSCQPMMDHIIPTFVFGHEFGHHMYTYGDDALIKEIEQAYEITEFSGILGEGDTRKLYAHVGTDYEYTIIGTRLFGAAQRQMRHAQNTEKLKAQIVEEVFCDLIALFMCIHECKLHKLDFSLLYLSFASIMEGVEQLRLLRSVADDLSFERETRLVTFSHPRMPARATILFYLIDQIANGNINAPAYVQDYLSVIKGQFSDVSTERGGLVRNQTLAQRALLEVVGETKESMAQRFKLSLEASTDPEEEKMRLMMLSLTEGILAPWSAPDEMVDPEGMLNWELPDNEIEGFEASPLYAFGNSVRLISQCLIDAVGANNEYGTEYSQFADVKTSQQFHLIRLPRILAKGGVALLPAEIDFDKVLRN